MKKRLTALLMLTLCMWVWACAGAEGEETIEYQGGVILRGIPRDDPNAELINIAYLRCDDAYVIVGKEVDYQVIISGGVAPYQVKVGIYWQRLESTSNSYASCAFPTVDGDYAFSYTYDKHARFFIQITVTDSKGQYVVFQPRPFESHPASSETDAATVVGKVNQIISETITPGMSEYAKAKVLHDWLIFNANYDYSYTYSGPEGVLLHGTGVCDSYARAYQKLLTAAGLQSIIVTGFGNGGYHGWNLVRVDGKWYHVDCTWDDPGRGGDERWAYFLLTDEQMAVDHDWNRENTDPLVMEGYKAVITPETSEDPIRDVEDYYEFQVTGMDEVLSGYEKTILPQRRGEMLIEYRGSNLTGFDAQLRQWAKELDQQLRSDGEGYMYYLWNSGKYYALNFSWTELATYIRIAEEKILGEVGEEITLTIHDRSTNLHGIIWQTSDATVATASDGVVACHGPGTAQITVLEGDRVLDSLTVTVKSAHIPDFGLIVTWDGAAILLAWDSIPGVTEYRVMRTAEGASAQIAETDKCAILLSQTQLSAVEPCQLSVVGNRVVDGEVVLSYTSEPVDFGIRISYSMQLPQGVKVIDAEAFRSTNIGNVYLPDGVTDIGANAFNGCAEMAAVRIPASVQRIGSNAFGEDLAYAVLTRDSAAHTWFKRNLPDVQLLFE